MIDVAQIRAARGLLSWSQADLAQAIGMSLAAVNNIERSVSAPRVETLNLIQKAFEKRGVVFTDSSGVKLQHEIVKIYDGEDFLRNFFDDVYAEMSIAGGQIYTNGVAELEFTNMLTVEYSKMHISRTNKIENMDCRALIEKGDFHFDAPYTEYRWMPEDTFVPVPYYAFNDKLAIILWGDHPKVVVHNHKAATDAFKKQFLYLWEKAEIPPETPLIEY